MRTSKMQEIQSLLNSGISKLKFPTELEETYRAQHLKQAIENLQHSVAYVFAVYAILGIGIYWITPVENLGIWPYSHFSIGVFILIGGGCAYTVKLNPWHQYYTAFCATCGIFITIIAPYYLTDPAIRHLTQLGTLYVVIVAYTCLGMRFFTASLSCFCAGFLSTAYALLFQLPMDWLVFHEMFSGANILGIVLAYLSEHRNRTVYLQSHLLELEKENSEQLAKTMEKMSREDALTGLANRRYFDAVYEREWNRAQRYGTSMSVMFIDIDMFKQYNDSYGHQQGDLCLQIIGKLIGDQAMRAGDLAARYGGEEFVVIYPQTSVDALKAIADRTQASILKAALEHEHSNVSDIVTLSIGLASCIPSRDRKMESLLKQADNNLYLAKERGRNQWIYSPLPPQS